MSVDLHRCDSVYSEDTHSPIKATNSGNVDSTNDPNSYEHAKRESNTIQQDRFNIIDPADYGQSEEQHFYPQSEEEATASTTQSNHKGNIATPDSALQPYKMFPTQSQHNVSDSMQNTEPKHGTTNVSNGTSNVGVAKLETPIFSHRSNLTRPASARNLSSGNLTASRTGKLSAPPSRDLLSHSYAARAGNPFSSQRSLNGSHYVPSSTPVCTPGSVTDGNNMTVGVPSDRVDLTVKRYQLDPVSPESLRVLSKSARGSVTEAHDSTGVRSAKDVLLDVGQYGISSIRQSRSGINQSNSATASGCIHRASSGLSNAGNSLSDLNLLDGTQKSCSPMDLLPKDVSYVKVLAESPIPDQQSPPLMHNWLLVDSAAPENTKSDLVVGRLDDVSLKNGTLDNEFPLFDDGDQALLLNNKQACHQSLLNNIVTPLTSNSVPIMTTMPDQIGNLLPQSTTPDLLSHEALVEQNQHLKKEVGLLQAMMKAYIRNVEDKDREMKTEKELEDDERRNAMNELREKNHKLLMENDTLRKEKRTLETEKRKVEYDFRLYKAANSTVDTSIPSANPSALSTSRSASSWTLGAPAVVASSPLARKSSIDLKMRFEGFPVGTVATANTKIAEAADAGEAGGGNLPIKSTAEKKKKTLTATPVASEEPAVAKIPSAGCASSTATPSLTGLSGGTMLEEEKLKKLRKSKLIEEEVKEDRIMQMSGYHFYYDTKRGTLATNQSVLMDKTIDKNMDKTMDATGLVSKIFGSPRDKDKGRTPTKGSYSREGTDYVNWFKSSDTKRIERASILKPPPVPPTINEEDTLSDSVYADRESHFFQSGEIREETLEKTPEKASNEDVPKCPNSVFSMEMVDYVLRIL